MALEFVQETSWLRHVWMQMLIVNLAFSEMKCPNFFFLEHGKFQDYSRDLGHQMEFYCDDGYELQGESSSLCQMSEREIPFWTNPLPKCVEILPVSFCPVTDTLSYGYCNVTSYESSGTRTCQCDHGFSLQGLAVAKCQQSGTWSASLPTCNKIMCPVLSPPLNGYLSSAHFMYNESVTYSCNSGYYLNNGNETRTCLISGQWSGIAPLCQPKLHFCSVPTPPVNGVLQFNGTNIGSLASFQCNLGYNMTGSPMSTCQLIGTRLQWSDQTPNCTVIKCPRLSLPLNGYLLSNGVLYNTTVSYGCNPGYRIKKHRTITCQISGQWSDTPPRCKLAECLAPRPLFNGQVLYNSTKLGSSVLFKCNAGYKLIGSTTSSCKLRGSQLQWSLRSPTCQMMTCSTLSGPTNGWLSISDFGNSKLVTYNCDPGYHLKNGSATRYCLVSGEWNGTAPGCEGK
ncbi:E-selectin-like [Corticium candelabrum]|uniref:E-selectin-like n=1 Tax=Corticium candelabrum TaxID=121492 RepID=UPI002E263F28|nr:E-selectin-like [Corticium candelabrum]